MEENACLGGVSIPSGTSRGDSKAAPSDEPLEGYGGRSAIRTRTEASATVEFYSVESLIKITNARPRRAKRPAPGPAQRGQQLVDSKRIGPLGPTVRIPSWL